MTKSELQRLIKIEERIKQIVIEEYGIPCSPVEFDVIPPEKMLEIMSYRGPTQISSWKYGRDYEKAKTIYDNVSSSLPYEVVISDNPSRAYLMNNNTFAVHALVIAHVYGHTAFFTNNKYFQDTRCDIISVLASASKRFEEYEKVFGIDAVEKIVDAGHALQWHTLPTDDETDEEVRLRIFQQERLMNRPDTSEFSDIVVSEKKGGDVEAYNNKLWRDLKQKTPVEPTGDLLRYIIDNSSYLDSWEKDILDILRIEGQYYWPVMKTKFIDEGYAVFIHEHVVNQLFREGLLTETEHGQFNHSNSLVKARNKMTLNPYLVGSGIWYDIEDRWNKGRHGEAWDNCCIRKEKEEWDTGAMEGLAKVHSLMETHTDWFFIQEYLTPKLIDEMDLYIYQMVNKYGGSVDFVRTEHTIDEIKDIIVAQFSNGGLPLIKVIDGNHNNDGSLLLEHLFDGRPLNKEYAEKTMAHIHHLWNRSIFLQTQVKDTIHIVSVEKS